MLISAENRALANAGFGLNGIGNSAAFTGGGDGSQPSIWSLQKQAEYNQIRAMGYPAFLSDAEMMRLDRIGQARDLLEGRHEEYFLRCGRSKFDFEYQKVNGITQKVYLAYNVLGLISNKSADLLFGQSPLLDCDDEDQWDALQDLARRTRLHSVLLDASISGSAEGEVFLETLRHTDGKVYIRQVPCEEIFPQGELQPDGQFASYVRRGMKNIGTDDAQIWILLETTIAAGMISRACYQLDKSLRKQKPIDLAYWDPALAGQDRTPTGIPMNTIVWIPNLRGRAISDYDGAIDLQDAVNAKNTQIAAILSKHSRPKLAFPQGFQDPQGNVPSAADALIVDDMAQAPKYITWDANLAAAIQDRSFHLNQLLVRTETSPVLLGLKEGAAPDAYKKVRLEAFNSVTKAGRKAIEWTNATQKILAAAMALENTEPGVYYAQDPVGVTLRDGIPVDESEQATNIATLRTAGVMSRRRAVMLQLNNEEATDAELAELDREAEASTPKVLLGAGDGKEPGEGGMNPGMPGMPGKPAGDEETGALMDGAMPRKNADGGGM